jgi:hypothetical protein
MCCSGCDSGASERNVLHCGCFCVVVAGGSIARTLCLAWRYRLTSRAQLCGRETHLLSCTGLSRRACCSRPRAPSRASKPMITARRCIQQRTSWRDCSALPACSKVPAPRAWPRQAPREPLGQQTSDPQHYPLLVASARSARSRSSRRSCAALSTTNRSIRRA